MISENNLLFLLLLLQRKVGQRKQTLAGAREMPQVEVLGVFLAKASFTNYLAICVLIISPC